MIYPSFTENADKGVILYFPLDGKNENELMKELEKVYYCYSAAGTVEKNGVKYVALTVEDEA